MTSVEGTSPWLIPDLDHPLRLVLDPCLRQASRRPMAAVEMSTTAGAGAIAAGTRAGAADIDSAREVVDTAMVMGYQTPHHQFLAPHHQQQQVASFPHVHRGDTCGCKSSVGTW
jgi:hypothetical protein